MARDILSEYGRDVPKPQAARAEGGGVEATKEIANYKSPVGPKGINDPKTPGLHGDNCGPCGTQGKR